MNLNPFNYPVDHHDREINPHLTDEFDSVYIMSLAAKLRAEKSKLQRQSWLSALGSWLVSLGLRLKHGAHPHLAARHVSARWVSVHNYRTHHRR